MEPLAQGAIRSRHRGDLREHGAFPVRLVRARAGARGRLLRGLLGRALAGLLRALRVAEFARSFLLRHQRLLSGSLPPAESNRLLRQLAQDASLLSISRNFSD